MASAGAVDARPDLRFGSSLAANGSRVLNSTQAGATLAGECRGLSFHTMLWDLCDEHDREVSALREQVASLQAKVRNAASSTSCKGDAASEDGERSLGVRKFLSSEPWHGAAPLETPCESEAVCGPGAPGNRAGEGAISDQKLEEELAEPAPERERASPKGARRASQRINKALFVDANAMKEKIRQAAVKPEYNVADFYHKQGVWQCIARHPVFEKLTCGIIAFNAFWIWIDTDANDADLILEADAQFQIVEYLFCMFFSFEWTCRFMAFASKINCLRDCWFVFDSGLVLFMVLETWVMTAILLFRGGGGIDANMAIVRLARLLRLSRMARMVRLFRMVPELLIMIKGIRAAFRSVFFTLCLLAIILYVFGIAFTQLVGKALKDKFGTVPTSMHTLLIDGTLLDGAGKVVQDLGDLNVGFAALFYIFVLLAALTVMNMLIGVLCEVVSAVSASEKEGIHAAFMKGQLEKVWEQVAGTEDILHGEITKEEFQMILQSVEACRALEEAGVDPIGLVDNIDFIFAGEVEDEDGNTKDKTLSFKDFVALLLTMRGTNTATVKDIVDLRLYLSSSVHALREDLRRARGSTMDDRLSSRGSIATQNPDTSNTFEVQQALESAIV